MKKQQLKAVLFDMDGVLYDSLPNHAYSWVKAMLDNGLSMTKEDVYANEGRIGIETIHIIAQREGKNIDLEERKRIYQEKTKLFAACPPTLVMPGSLELLKQVTTDGLIAKVVTGSGQPSLFNKIHVDFQGYIKQGDVLTSFDFSKGKPDPEAYLTALKKWVLKACEVVVVENAPLGVESAKAAGLFVIAVNTGPLPDSSLIDAGADLLFPSLQALSDHWANIPL